MAETKGPPSKEQYSSFVADRQGPQGLGERQAAVTEAAAFVPDTKFFWWRRGVNPPMHWKTGDGRVTLAIDDLQVTVVKTIDTNGHRLEYTNVAVEGHTWNPCYGFCASLYIHLKDKNQGDVKVIDFGTLVGECDKPFTMYKTFHYSEQIFDLIEWCGRSGSSYSIKPC